MRYIVLALVPGLTGCIVRADDQRFANPPPPVAVNHAPYVYRAEAGVYWDDFNYDDIWHFTAQVDDPDGVYDVTAVYVDIYDDRSGQFVDTFELYPTGDAYTWFSDWLGRSTYLDPWYDAYRVDFVVYDTYGDAGATTVYASYY